jgi:cytochrome c-type biogenesis protein CcmF
LAFACLAIGVAGSSLGSRQQEVAMRPGDVLPWAGRTVRYAGLAQRDLPEKHVVEAVLEVFEPGSRPYVLRPAQNLYRAQNQWSAEVAIHGGWSGDFYTIFHGSKDRERINLTLIENPAMRWLWSAGWLGALGALLAIWPVRKRPARSADGPPPSKVAIPKLHRPARSSVRSASHD